MGQSTRDLPHHSWNVLMLLLLAVLTNTSGNDQVRNLEIRSVSSLPFSNTESPTAIHPSTDFQKCASIQTSIKAGWVEPGSMAHALESAIIFSGLKISGASQEKLVSSMRLLNLTQGTGHMLKPLNSSPTSYFKLSRSKTGSSGDQEVFQPSVRYRIDAPSSDRFGLLIFSVTCEDQPSSQPAILLGVFGATIETLLPDPKHDDPENHSFLKRLKRLRIKSFFREEQSSWIANSTAKGLTDNEILLSVAKQSFGSVLKRSHQQTNKLKGLFRDVNVTIWQTSDLFCTGYFAKINNLNKVNNRILSRLGVVSLSNSSHLSVLSQRSLYSPDEADSSILFEAGVTLFPRHAYIRFEGRNLLKAGYSSSVRWLVFNARSCFSGPGTTKWTWKVTSSNKKHIQGHISQTEMTTGQFYRKVTDASDEMTPSAVIVEPVFFTYNGLMFHPVRLWFKLAIEKIINFLRLENPEFEIKNLLATSATDTKPTFLSSTWHYISEFSSFDFLMLFSLVILSPLIFKVNIMFRGVLTASIAITAPRTDHVSASQEFWHHLRVWLLLMVCSLIASRVYDWLTELIRRKSKQNLPENSPFFIFCGCQMICPLTYMNFLLESRELWTAVYMSVDLVQLPEQTSSKTLARQLLVGFMLKIALYVVGILYCKLTGTKQDWAVGYINSEFRTAVNLRGVTLNQTFFERNFILLFAFNDLFKVISLICLSLTPNYHQLGFFWTVAVFVIGLYFLLEMSRTIPLLGFQAATLHAEILKVLLFTVFILREWPSKVPAAHWIYTIIGSLVVIVVHSLAIKISSRGQITQIPAISSPQFSEMGTHLGQCQRGFEDEGVFSRFVFHWTNQTYYEGISRSGYPIGPGRLLEYDHSKKEWTSQFHELHYSYWKKGKSTLTSYRSQEISGGDARISMGTINHPEEKRRINSLISLGYYNLHELEAKSDTVIFTECANTSKIASSLKLSVTQLKGYSSGTKVTYSRNRFSDWGVGRVEGEYVENDDGGDG